MNKETASGIVLLLAAALALILDNSPFAWLYDALLTTPVTVMVGDFGIDKSLLHWINDGLMAIFFFFIGLEVKREILAGELSDIKKAALPIVAALGGILAPAAFYTLINIGDTIAMQGWGIAVATDIAFALGVLALLGDRVPRALKILLLSLAIIDDVAAILIIALFYTSKISLIALLLMGAGFIGAIALNRFGVRRIAPYVLVGLFMWVCALKSGVHATLAGVLLATTIPLIIRKPHKDPYWNSVDEPYECPLEHIMHMLKPWVFFAIMPIFAFANAGLNIGTLSPEMIGSGLTLGIIAGLFLGKQLGVFAAIWLSVKTGLCRKPEGVNWLQLYGLSILTGIGFTMSLFIGMLAFDAPDLIAQVRLGVLIASLFAAIAGYSILRYSFREKKEKAANGTALL